jgi:hypothetical protein
MRIDTDNGRIPVPKEFQAEVSEATDRGADHPRRGEWGNS